MTYPTTDEIKEVLDRIGDSMNPSAEEREAVEGVLVELIKTKGLTASQAYELLRTIFWSGWNEGWHRGYRAPRAGDHRPTLL